VNQRYFVSGLVLLLGIALLIMSLILRMVLSEANVWTMGLALVGALFTIAGAFLLRSELYSLVSQQRGEIVLTTLGIAGILVALAYLSLRYPARFDMTEEGLHSLSEQTEVMLQRLEKPVHVVFFHDPLMRKTVELYELMAAHNPLVTTEFHDPTLNPARARIYGVQFAGTAILVSEDRKVTVNGGSETDIANGILRVTQGAKQRICFLDGHNEADPFSSESHDHLEGDAGHSHGMGAKFVLHERHGLAKARHALETVNYRVEKISLVRADHDLAECAVLIVAGPKVALLDIEIKAIEDYLAAGGNGFFMIDPFVQTGLKPVIRQYGVFLDDTIVLDEASHFWTDASSPAVTRYNHHQVTRELPLTFYPGVRSLSPTAERVVGTNVTPIVSTSTNSYGETDRDHARFDAGTDIRGPATLMVIAQRRPADPNLALAQRKTRDLIGGQDGPAGAPPAGPAVTGHSRVAIVGDSDFATNSFFHFLGNGNLFLNTVNYLAAQENLIGIEPRTYDPPRLSVTNRQIKATFVLTVLLLPMLLAVTGIAVWWRQR
jgi:ABC-type uncharacterized transport system involved in gliding motility auxiliary subunit